jgi:hypothetical protein
MGTCCIKGRGRERGAYPFVQLVAGEDVTVTLEALGYALMVMTNHQRVIAV